MADVNLSLGSDEKFQRFASSVDKALKGFEVSQEWPDLIQSLTRLHKVLLAYTHYSVLPHKRLVCRRLSQCLHPALPAGVHLKVLDIYKAIYDRIGHEGLLKDLFLYSCGLLPLLDYGSSQVRSTLLDMYDEYYLPLGPGLSPSLLGLVPALLPCLEEGCEYSDRVSHILNSLYHTTHQQSFIVILWDVLLSFVSLRLPALLYIYSHISKGTSDIFKSIKDSVTHETAIMAIKSALHDSNVLVQRYSLDVVNHLFHVQTSQVIMEDVLVCLLMREQSILRRVLSWLLGNKTHLDNAHNFFATNSKLLVVDSLCHMLRRSSNDAGDVPYRIMGVLCDQLSELTREWIPEVMENIVINLKSQKDQGVDEKELVKMFNQFLISFDNEILWGWMKEYSINILKSKNSSNSDIMHKAKLVIFLLKLLPLVNMDGAITTYIPNFILHIIVVLSEHIRLLSLPLFRDIVKFIIQLFNLWKPLIGSASSDESLRSGLVVAPIITQWQSILCAFISIHVCDMEGVSADEVVAMAIKDRLTSYDVPSWTCYCHSSDGDGDGDGDGDDIGDDISLSFNDICSLYLDLISLFSSFSDISKGHPSLSSASLPWLQSLILCSVYTTNIHIYLTCLSTLCQLSDRTHSTSYPVISDELMQIHCRQLWSLLSPSLAYHHELSARVLNSLLSLSPSIESHLLKCFSDSSIEHHKRFATFWQFANSQQDNIKLPTIERLIIRMIEGIQSNDTSVVYFSSTWIINTCNSHFEHCLFPLYNLLIKSSTGRVKVPTVQTNENSAHSKYFKSTELATPPSLSYPVFYFNQLLDVPRYCYGISLFLSIISLSPVLMCRVLASTMLSSAHDLANKSYLQAILTNCVEVLSSSYPDWMNITEEHQKDLYKVKVLSVSLVIKLLLTFIDILNDGGISAGEVIQSNYVSGLLALCEVQKTIITLSLHLAKEYSNGHDSSCESLYIHLMRSLYCLIAIESMASSDDAITINDSSSCVEYATGHAILSQLMFQSLLTHSLSLSTDNSIQMHFLALLRVSLPHFKENLESIAPKVIQVVCSILISIIKKDFISIQPSSSRIGYNSQLIVSYIRTFIDVVCYTLTTAGAAADPQSSLSLHYSISDPFWDLTFPVANNKSLPNVAAISSKSNSSSFISFSWLFGGIFSGGHNHEASSVDTLNDGFYRGIGSPAGQKVLWSLYIAYKSLTYFWTDASFSHCHSNLFQDVNALGEYFLQQLLAANDILLYSSIAQLWMRWNSSGSKNKQRLKEAFLRMIQSYQLQPLNDMLASLTDTFSNMRKDGSPSNLDRQKYLLHFLYSYISSPQLTSEELTQHANSVVHFVKECHGMMSGDHTGNHGNAPSLCMLMSILHAFVCRSSMSELKSIKKKRREIQDVLYHLSEVLSQIVAQQPLLNTEDNEDKSHDSHVTVTGHRMQSMAVLANVLSHFVDCIYDSSDKDRVISLLKVVLKNVWSSLHHSNDDCYGYGVKLLASLSGYQVTRKCWKDEAMDCFIHNNFFVMDQSSINDWKVIIDNLMAQDKVMFRSLLNKLPSASASVSNVFSSLEIERLQRARIFKRIAFALMCSERGQYVSFINDIKEKILDNIKWYSGPTLNAQVLNIFKVLLLKVSHGELVTIWPALTAELTYALNDLGSDVALELATPLKATKDKLVWYYSSCKLLDTALDLSVDSLPQFKMISWGFFNPSTGVVCNILKCYEESLVDEERDVLEVTGVHDLTCAVDLISLLLLLVKKSSDKCIVNNLTSVEQNILNDFIEVNK